MKTFNYKLLIKLLTYASPYKYLFIGTIFISIFFGLLSTIRPILIQYAFDNFILNNDTIGLLNIIIIIFFLLLIESMLHFVFVYQSNALSQKIINNIRNEVFEKILSFKLSYFDNTPTGQLITRVVSDMEAVASVFSQGLLVVFGDFFKISLIIICMMIMNFKLALISLLFLPFLIFSTILFQKYMQKAFVDVRKYISKINVFVYEHIIGISIVQIFGREKAIFNRFNKLNTLHRDAHIKTVLYFSIFLPIVDVCSAIAMGLLVWYGSIQAVINSTVTVGEIIAFILFINMLFRPLRGIADRFNILQMGMVAAHRVFEITKNTLNTEKYHNDKLIEKLVSGSIVFNNVSFSYKIDEPVLENIDFEINKDQTLAIIGPTGSGKTTIINLLMKWYDLSNGHIYVSGQDIKSIPINTLRHNIGVVLQDTFFLADTLMNNIKFFNNISDNDVYKAVQDIGLQDFIDKFPSKYNYRIGERGAGLSEGEKQLISFLRTYLLNPTYLILDEATSSLDPRTEFLIQKSIKKITQKRTSIIIAHRLSTIKYADKIIVLENGKIIESGDHNELIHLNGKYANYYYQQFLAN